MKYKPSALAGEFSGSAGSITASHNRGGPYLRTRTIPTNPRTAAQTAVRGLYDTVSAAWRTLSDAQRAAWVSLGLLMERIDTLGSTYSLTGSQAHQSVNINLLTTGAAITAVAPVMTTPAAVASATVTATGV